MSVGKVWSADGLGVGDGLGENTRTLKGSLRGDLMSWLKLLETKTLIKVWPEASPASSSPGGSFGAATGSVRGWGGACASARWDRYGYRG